MMEALKNFRINNKVMLLVDRKMVMSTLECVLWFTRSFRFQDSGMLSQRNLQNVRGSEVSQWKKSGINSQTVGSWSLKPDNLLKWEPSTPEILCGSRVCAEVKGVQYKLLTLWLQDESHTYCSISYKQHSSLIRRSLFEVYWWQLD
ncbi:hypothetical protein Bca101_093607 [Brassica carinata]